VNIPGEFWINMRSSPLYFLDVPFEKRLDHLVMEYGRLDKQKMIEAIMRIREKLGGLNAQTAARLLEEGNTRESFSILLKYYDKFYFKALHNRKELETLLHTIPCKSVTTENAQLLVNQSKYQTESL
jgi:tRNA 2-selenouridine synthase